MTTEYVSMLSQSLEKKKQYLRLLLVRCKEQTAILQDNFSTPEQLDDNIAQKGELIDDINILDDGFEQLFARVKDELENNKEKYALEIAVMQGLIRDITDLTADIEATERRNKEYATARFSNLRKEAKEISKSSNAVSAYYKNAMAKVQVDGPQFYDSKK